MGLQNFSENKKVWKPVATTVAAGSMNPGNFKTASVDITNAGTLPAKLYLSTQNVTTTTATGPAFLQHLNMTIKDGATCIYGFGSPGSYTCPDLTVAANCTGGNPGYCAVAPGNIAAVANIPLPGGATNWTAGEHHTYSITVEFDGSANSDVADFGSVCAATCPTVSVDFVWASVQ